MCCTLAVALLTTASAFAGGDLHRRAWLSQYTVSLDTPEPIDPAAALAAVGAHGGVSVGSTALIPRQPGAPDVVLLGPPMIVQSADGAPREGTQDIVLWPGRAYLLILRWVPGQGPGAAALVSRDAAGRPIAEHSIRFLLRSDGTAFAGPFIAGGAGERYHFPPGSTPREPLSVAAHPEYTEASIRIDPIPPAVATVALVLGAAEPGDSARFAQPSLYPLSAGATVLDGPTGPIAVAKAGVPLDPRRLWPAQGRARVATLDAVRGQVAELRLALPDVRGRARLEADDLEWVETAGDRLPSAAGSLIRRERIHLESIVVEGSRADAFVPADEVRDPLAVAYRLLVTVPDATAPGTYRGTVRIEPANGNPGEIDLQVSVADVSLAGNLVTDAGFERTLALRPAGWRLENCVAEPLVNDVETARSGARALALEPQADEAPAMVESGAIVPRLRAPHLLELALRREGARGDVEVELEGVGRVRLPATGGLDSSFIDPTVEEEPGGWSILRAEVTLNHVDATALRIRAWPAPDGERAVLLIDDVMLRALPIALEETSRFESITANPSFDDLRASEVEDDWQLVAAGDGLQASPRTYEPLRGDDGRIRLSAATLPSGVELRSSTFSAQRGDRLRFSLRACHAGDVTLRLVMRFFDRERRPIAPGDAGIELPRDEPPTTFEQAQVWHTAGSRAGCQDVTVRVLDVPERAQRGALVVSVVGDSGDGAVLLDELRAVRPRTRWSTSGVSIHGLAGWHGLRLWRTSTENTLRGCFERLAGFGIKPDVPTPESFEDFADPGSSVAPDVMTVASAQRWVEWALWWWRRGELLGAVGLHDEQAPRVIEEFFATWMPEIRATGLTPLAWTPAPIESPCNSNPASLARLERWAETLNAVAPELRRLAEPCVEMDEFQRESLIGWVDTWVVPVFDRTTESTRALGALLERQERGELVWGSLAADLDRLDVAPARPRAAIWRAWRLGYDGIALRGLTEYWPRAGLGTLADGSFTLAPEARAAPGLLLWPAPGHLAVPSERLIQLSLGLEDVRLLRMLEGSLAEAEAFLGTLVPADDVRSGPSREGEAPVVADSQSERVRLLALTSAARRALAAMREHAAQPMEELAAADLEDGRRSIIQVIELLEQFLRQLRRRAVGLEPDHTGWWGLPQPPDAHPQAQPHRDG